MVSYEKVELLIKNSNELGKAGGAFTANSFRKCSALSATLRGEAISATKVDKAIKIIKNKTSLVSYFRGNNLFNTAIRISFEEDMEGCFKEIESIYEKLKAHFFSNQYLVLASIVIYNSRDRIDIDEAVKNTRVVYDCMKKNHIFLTGQEDISAAAMIATTSTNYQETFLEIEEYYIRLKNSGFWGGNNLQSLSHILPLFNGSVDEKLKRVVKVEKALIENKVALKNFSIPLLGIAAFVADDVDAFAKDVREVSDKVREVSGFGNFALGARIRNMICVGIVVSDYVDRLDEADKERLIDTTNNIALTIQIAIEIAAASAAAAGAAAAAASS